MFPFDDVRVKSPETEASLLAGGERGVDPPDTKHAVICFSKLRECGVAEERESCEATKRSVHHSWGAKVPFDPSILVIVDLQRLKA